MHIDNFISNYIIIYSYVNFKRNMNNNKYLYFRKDYMYGEARLSYAYKIIFMCTFSTYFLEK
ncbi:hypothetical protein CANFE03_10260 [Ligilactobacillus animalis]